MDLHILIKEKRKTLGLDAGKLATMLGISRATYYRYESNDIKKMPFYTVVKIFRILRIDPSCMGWTDDPTPRAGDAGKPGAGAGTAAGTGTAALCRAEVRAGSVPGRSPGGSAEILTDTESRHLSQYRRLTADGQKAVDNFTGYTLAQELADAELMAQKKA